MNKASQATSYSYTAEGNLIRIEAVTAAGIATVRSVTLAQALEFAITQARQAK